MNDELVESLERLVTVGFAQPRRRSREEGPSQLTSAYVKQIAGYGFARLGAIERAREVTSEGVAQLADVMHDPVHAWLTSAFTARVEMAIAGRPSFAMLPAEILDQRVALDRIAAYKVGRVWDASWILAPGYHQRDEAIATFSNRTKPVRPVAVFEVDGLTDLGERVEHAASLERDAAFCELGECLGRLGDLPEATAMPILVRAVELVDAMPDVPVTLRCAVLSVIAQFGWGELVPSMFAPFATELANVSIDQLAAPVGNALQALRRLDARETSRQVIDAFSPRLDQLPPIGRDHGVCRLFLAGALSWHGDPRGAQIFDDAHRYFEPQTLTNRLDATRIVAAGYAFAAIPTAIEGIKKLFEQWTIITDPFGTNSHYSYSVLSFAESLILGLSEARVGRSPP